MTIVAMSKLRSIVPKSALRPLIKDLTQTGCVEIGSSAERLAEDEWAEVLKKYFEPTDADRRLGVLTSALELLDKHAPVKTGFLTPRRLITEREFQNETTINEACAAAETINELGRQLTAFAGEENRLIAKKASFTAWSGMDVPLDVKSGKHYKILFGVSPTVGAPPQELINEASLRDLAELTLISADREQNYYLLMIHNSLYDELMDRLKSRGFSIVTFKDVEGTASENISQLDRLLAETAAKRQQTIEKIKELAGRKESFEHAIDVFTIESKKDQVVSGLAGTKETLFLEGWVPTARETEAAAVLDGHGCAYQFSAPEEEDDVPVLLQNNKYVTPVTLVTELFALPTYRSGMDPNPFMAPFFFIAFGIMTGDVVYGLLMTFIAWYMLKRLRPETGGGMYNALRLVFLCGLSGAIWGVLFGGFFGNAIPAVTGEMLGFEIAPRAFLFDPLKDPMKMFIMALGFGIIQLCFGLCLKGYQLFRRGMVIDAISDVGFHLCIIIGAALYIIFPNVGRPILVAGAFGIILTGGREKKNIFMRLFGGLYALYNCINYLADVLSYSRLLGLGLAGAVIAQVMNTMATLGGPGIIGWIAFLLIFIIGHTFNLLLSLIGNFVHASRLQFIEFYGKFYEYGGRLFTPLFNRTKYVEIIKEAS